MGLFGGGGAKTPKATAQEKALATDAVIKFNDHQRKFVPLEDSFIASLEASKGERRSARGTVASDVAQATGSADRGIVAGSRGADAQGKSVLARAGVSSAAGIARGEAVGGANAALRTREMTGLQKMTAFGRGLQDMNSLSLGDASRTASGDAISKLNTKVTNRGTMMDGLGNFAGTAMGNIGAMDSLGGQLQDKYGMGW